MHDDNDDDRRRESQKSVGGPKLHSTHSLKNSNNDKQAGAPAHIVTSAWVDACRQIGKRITVRGIEEERAEEARESFRFRRRQLRIFFFFFNDPFSTSSLKNGSSL